MSREIVTIGRESLADNTGYCPNCGIQIDYQNHLPNYCPKCGADIDVSIEVGEDENQ